MARKGKSAPRLVKDHPKPVKIIDPQTMDPNVTVPDQLAEDEQLSNVVHRIELDNSLYRDDPSTYASELDPAPPEGNWSKTNRNQQ